MNFSLYYRKTKMKNYLKTLEKSNIGLKQLQNYVPLYEKIFFIE